MNRSLPLIFLNLFFAASSLFAQSDVPVPATLFSENLLVETRWKYAYTVHLESNTVVHQAEETYEQFLYFRYDYNFRHYVNGSISEGYWKMDGGELECPIKQLKKFGISNLTDHSLDLEFSRPGQKGAFAYHFNRVEPSEAPFLRPVNELPEVLVEAENPNLFQKVIAKKEEKRAARRRKKEAEKKTAEPEVFVSIELIGGGFYGGIDPVLRDYVVIKNDGRLIKEFKSVNHELTVTKKTIPREELVRFAEWCVGQRFFEMKRQYDCEKSFCEKRKNQRPQPIPLRISVTYGNVRKMVTVSIWGYDDAGVKYVDYPPQLDLIIDAIQRMANRLES